ncbi:MAG: 5-deoxy-glucuronate isomerase [Rubrobacteraceae bacterium]|nr:5-deoxy-glucuronate isomerase [Rubrobacter sp.]
MSDLIVGSESPDTDGSVLKVTPESAGWNHVGFEIVKLAEGRSVERRADGVEVCLVILSGACNVSAGENEWEDVGGRKSPFDGLPHAVYLPPGTSYRVEAGTEDVEVAICSAPAERGVDERLIGPEDIEVSTRGSGNSEREVRNILMDSQPAESLLVVEVITPNGHWSSYPPHKHDRDDRPNETYLEETYYHRVRPEQGFAIQKVYTEDRSLDETLTVRDGDTVLVPAGYHAVSAPPGYDLYYLNVMAGPAREWKVKNDPEHEWLVG